MLEKLVILFLAQEEDELDELGSMLSSTDDDQTQFLKHFPPRSFV